MYVMSPCVCVCGDTVIMFEYSFVFFFFFKQKTAYEMRISDWSSDVCSSDLWKREGQALVLQTLQSNGMPIDTNDPIYTNRYAVSSLAGSSLAMRHADGSSIKARRMSPGYRLPF